MKTVLLLRHAKSSWAHPDLSDFDRPLNDRGKRDAPRMGRLIGQMGLTPELIFCSTARRARKTAAKVARECDYQGEIQIEDSLYLAPPTAYVQLLHTTPDEVSNAMFVGHNPGMEALLEWLTGAFEFMPTAGLASIHLDIDQWTEVIPRCGKLVELWRPKELTDD